MSSVQYILRYLSLVPIQLFLLSLPAGGVLGQIRGNLMCDILLGDFGNPCLKTSAPVYFHPHPSPGFCISGTLSWMRNSTSWYWQTLVTVFWCEGEGSNCPGLIPWSCTQKSHFGGDSRPRIILPFVHRSGLPPWTGYLQIFRCPPYRLIPWPRGCLLGYCRLPWSGFFLRWGSPRELSIAVVVVVVHKYSGWP